MYCPTNSSLTPAYSNYRKCRIAEAWNMGYAGQGQMVRNNFILLFQLQLETRDAWAKHKDLNSYEAKWLYVDALLKVSKEKERHFAHSITTFQVLRKYSDKTMARSLVEELESYGGDPNNLVLSGASSWRPNIVHVLRGIQGASPSLPTPTRTHLPQATIGLLLGLPFVARCSPNTRNCSPLPDMKTRAMERK